MNSLFSSWNVLMASGKKNPVMEKPIVADLDLTNCSNSRSRWLFLATQCKHQNQLWWSKWTCSSGGYLEEHVCTTIIGHTKRNASIYIQYISGAVFTKATIEYAEKPLGNKGNMKTLHTSVLFPKRNCSESEQNKWNLENRQKSFETSRMIR